MRRTCLLVFALGCTSNTWGKTVAQCATLDEQQQCVPACDDVEGCPEGTLCRVIADGAQRDAICCSGTGCPPFVPFSNPCDDAGPSCVVAAIHVSASTNSAPVDVVVHADGSAERTIEPGPQNIPTTPKSFLAGPTSKRPATSGCTPSFRIVRNRCRSGRARRSRRATRRAVTCSACRPTRPPPSSRSPTIVER